MTVQKLSIKKLESITNKELKTKAKYHYLDLSTGLYLEVSKGRALQLAYMLFNKHYKRAKYTGDNGITNTLLKVNMRFKGIKFVSVCNSLCE